MNQKKLASNLLAGVLLAGGAAPALAQDLCLRLDDQQQSLGTWGFHVTGTGGVFRSIAGGRLNGPETAHGTLSTGETLVTVVFTAHGSLDEPEGVVKFARCDLDAGSLAGPGERIRLFGDATADRTPMNCRVVSCP